MRVGIKAILKVLMVIWLTISIFLFFTFLFMPFCIERCVLPDFFLKAGINEYKTEIFYIDPYGLNFSLTLFEKDKTLLLIPDARLEWSSIFSSTSRADLITIYEPEIRLEIKNGKLQLPVFLQNIQESESASNGSKPFSPLILPFKTGGIKVVNAKFLINDHKISSSLNLNPHFIEAKNNGGFKLSEVETSLNGVYKGNELKAGAYISFLKDKINLNADLYEFPLNLIHNLPFSLIPDKAEIRGNLRARLEAGFSTSPFRVYEYDFQVFAHEFSFEQENTEIILASDSGDHKQIFFLSGKGEKFFYRIENLAFAGPVNADIELSGNVTLADGVNSFKVLEALNTLYFKVNSVPLFKNITGSSIKLKPLIARIDSKLTLDRENNWQFNIERQKIDKGKWIDANVNGDIELVTGVAEIEVKGGGSLNNGEIEYVLRMPDMRLSSSQINSRFNSLSVKGDIIYDWQSKRNRINNSFSLNNGRVVYPDKELAAKGIDLAFDFKGLLKDSEPIEIGSLNVKSIKYKGLETGSFKTSIKYSQNGLTADGKFKTPFIADSFIGTSLVYKTPTGGEEPEITISAKLEPSFLNLDPVKEVFLPLVPWDLKGRVGFEAVFKSKGCETVARANLDLSGLYAFNEDLDLKMDGAELKIRFSDLLSFTTPSYQRFSFTNLETGKVKIRNGDIFFRLDGINDLTMEKMSVNWCGGTVYGSDIHIRPGREEYSATLFCHQLQFAEILNLFNSVTAHGKGTLNGRLPVLFSNGRFEVENGLLMSSPGEGGNVQITGSQMFQSSLASSGINSSSAYLDFAMQSLGNFNYDWARLDINSEQETLGIKMKLKGKSAKPLSFKYDRRGNIVRYDPGENKRGQGITHPLMLEVNFSIPFNKLFRYGMKWKELGIY